jgi:hypothetical protein
MRRVLATLFAGVAGALVLSTAAAAGSSTTISDDAEAWYATAPTSPCSAPVGCPPEPATAGSAYPAGTLHVGVAGGAETGRTYLALDVASLALASVQSATLHLPLAADNVGNQNVSSAALIVCLATGAIPNGVSGSTSTPPPTDCKQPSHISYDAKHNEFTADLAPVIAAWQSGQTPYGVAVVPAPGATSTDNWQVSFAGKAASDTAHVHTDVLLADANATVITPTPAPPPVSSAIAPPPVSPTSPVATGSGTTTAPAPAALPVVAPPATQPVAVRSSLPLGVAFPIGTFLILPLLLVVGAVLALQVLNNPRLLSAGAGSSRPVSHDQPWGAT